MPGQQGSENRAEDGITRGWRADVSPVRRRTPRGISRRHKNMILPGAGVRTTRKVPGPEARSLPTPAASSSSSKTLRMTPSLKILSESH